MIGELYDGEFENFTRDNVEINDHEERIKEMAEALNMIPISVIADIEAEIIKLIEMDGGSYEYDSGLKRALGIIDKHIRCIYEQTN